MMSMSDKKVYVLLGGVVTFLVVLFGIIYFWGPKGRVYVPAQTAPTTKEQLTRQPLSEVTRELTYASYIDPEWRFAFEYPFGWDVDENPGEGVAVKVRNSVSDRVNESLGRQADILVIYYPSSSSDWQETCAEFRPPDSRNPSCRDVVVAGIPSLLIDEDDVPTGIENVTTHNRQLIVTTEKAGAVMQTRAYTGAWQKYDQIFTRVVGSFRLLPGGFRLVP